MMKKIIGLCLVCMVLATFNGAGGYQIVAQAYAQQQQAKPTQDPELRAAITKSNAYIGLLNRGIRASEGWERYTSWVNVKTGPTGKERYISYGLYSPYDMRDEIKKAREVVDLAPVQPELDATVKRYIDAFEVLAPVMIQANGYYERKDYKSDNMAEGKVLHLKMVPAAEVFLRERSLLMTQFRPFKNDIDRKELAAIEAIDGKKARWHVKNVMIEGGNMMRMMPSNAAPVVDMPAFDEVLNRYASAVREMDMFSQATPNQFVGFEGQPRTMLGKLRDFRDKLAKAKGDARRGAGNDMVWISNDYNMMVSMSDIAVRNAR